MALNNAMKSATTAQQKAEIAMARWKIENIASVTFVNIGILFYIIFRANNARSKAHSAEIYAKQARNDSIEARASAKLAAPDFRQPGYWKIFMKEKMI